MAKNLTPTFCSDEELLEELRKLGYNDDVPPEVFDMMKDDLAELISREESKISSVSSVSSPSIYKLNTSEPSTRAVKNSPKERSSNLQFEKVNDYSRTKVDSGIPVDVSLKKHKNISRGVQRKRSNNISLEHIQADAEDEDILQGSDHDVLSELNYSIEKLSVSSKNAGYKDHNELKIPRHRESCAKPNYSREFDMNTVMSPVSRYSKYGFRSVCDKNENGFMKSYQNHYAKQTGTNHQDVMDNLKFNVNPDKSEEDLMPDINLNASQSSVNSEIKTMKRKVLRRRNGRSIITEEILEIPSIFDTSYPESDNLNSSKSFSSDDLSYKSNSSTGSLTAQSPESLKPSPSTFSLHSMRSTSLRVPNLRKKKSDPVAMYNYYKKFWDNFQPPGEKHHEKLRWAVRDKMLDYNL